MENVSFQGYDTTYIIYLCLAILAALFVCLISSYLTYRLVNAPPSVSPYTKFPLRRASDISYENKERVLRYLYNLHQFDNQMFDFEKAALCRETGRIFPDAVNWFGVIQVDWNFINKRHAGNYVSWGSLSDVQREIVRSCHHSLDGFQTEFSSPEPAPRRISEFYVLRVPGPLYVDLDTKILIGWKTVPMTDLEVLIVQKPKGLFEVPKSLQ